MFDRGSSSDPAKFSKSLKSIEFYIQKMYKMPDNIIKAIQKMKCLTLAFPVKPTKWHTQIAMAFSMRMCSTWENSPGRRTTRL
jgi:hypothetical protein